MNVERISEIRAVAANVQHLVNNAESQALAAITEGWPVDRFQRHMLSQMEDSRAALVPQPQSCTSIDRKTLSRFSIGNVIAGLTRGHLDGLEREISDELARSSGMQANGAWIPYAAMSQRDNLFVTGTIGGNVSPTNLLASEYIDALRNRAMVVQMGARVLTGLQGTINLPRLTTPSVITNKTEGQAYATSTPVFGQVTLTPKIAPGLVRFSKLLAVQSNPAIEQLVRDDLVRQINIEVDRQCLHGAGSGGEATGLSGQGIAAIPTLIAGITPSLALSISLETEVAQDNADLGVLGYLTNSKVRGKLKATLQDTAGGGFVWSYPNGPQADGMGVVNGYKAGATNQILSNITSGTVTTAASAMFFGNWADLLLGYFGGGIDLTVDQISTPGWVAVHGQQYFDVAVRHPESFAWTNNLITT